MVRADAGSILERTTGPKLIDAISNTELSVYMGRTHNKISSCLDLKTTSTEVELGEKRGAVIISRTI